MRTSLWFLAKMASQAVFAVGDIVTCRGKTCLLTEIRNQLGFNRYFLTNLDTGENLTGFGYELGKCEIQAVGLEDEMDEELTVAVDEQATDADADADAMVENEDDDERWADLTNDDIDRLAENRHSKHTATQTKWAVQVFRGEWLYCGSIVCIGITC